MKIIRDLKTSPFRYGLTLESGDEVAFVFNSEKRLIKYTKEVDQAIEDMNSRFSLRYNVNIDFGLIAAIELYRSIQKENFLFVINEEDYFTSLNDLFITAGLSEYGKE